MFLMTYSFSGSSYSRATDLPEWLVQLFRQYSVEQYDTREASVRVFGYLLHRLLIRSARQHRILVIFEILQCERVETDRAIR